MIQSDALSNVIPIKVDHIFLADANQIRVFHLAIRFSMA